MGEFHDNLTLEQALEVYDKIPAERMNGIKSIGFSLEDGSIYSGMFDLMVGGEVQAEIVNHIQHYRESPLVQKAISDMKTLLEKYCAAFAPSGQEDELREMIASDVAPYADELRTDRSGSLIAFKKGRKRRAEKLLFSAHMDEVGFMVTHISEEGFAYFGTIGGIDPRVTAGKRVLLGDKRLPGVIAAKAIHMQKPEERGVPAPIEEMFIDIGALSEENTKSLVSVGDCAVFAPNFETFGDGFIKSKAIDDRFGCALLVRLLMA